MTDKKYSRPTGNQSADQVHEEADGGPALDAADSRAERKLAERAGLIPTRTAPALAPVAADETAPLASAHTSRGPTTAQVWEIAALLVGEGLTLSLEVLAIVADARATWQDDKGGKAAASQYRHCAHHLRQAATTLARCDNTTDEERAGTADMASGYVEAAATHAREADLTAI